MQSNKLEYSTAAGVYCTMHDVKVHLCMTYFSSSKIFNHRFHVNNNKGESGIDNDMIIGRDLVVQLGPTTDFKHQVLKWDDTTVHRKEPISLIGKSVLNKCEMRKVVIQNAEPASTIRSTE